MCFMHNIVVIIIIIIIIIRSICYYLGHVLVTSLFLLSCLRAKIFVICLPSEYCKAKWNNNNYLQS